MANNRMFLIHRPSGVGVGLGKNMGEKWYNAPEGSEIGDFYEHISQYGDFENLVLATEFNDNEYQFGEWSYTGEEENGFPLFTINQ